ncbi:SDR family oxidoreductase [Aureibaculum sp. 2210JD6-5]|uniref:enoyl-ACP reductase FabI n=1 Tax=Aureibaculum sp. 2210JD6-5 TaxID=3103957 RepID=UPI002AAEB2BC|nr:SDR family oxidoreductase [Aureibaculum sp. 2210JD6-5]MDY7395774.1 SDR family oxidoreductase [Aureibaculum sp. 2210JD6-5]
MVKEFQHNEWALILGGSSGLGLATAQKLAKHGLNICIVHRNRRSELPQIEKKFSEIKSTGVEMLTFNEDAFKQETRTQIIEQFSDKGSIKVLVHSVAKGNLKPMISEDKPTLKNDDFHLTLDAMAFSLYDWTKAIFEAQLFAEDARIISFTSEGNTKAWQNYAAVSAAKTALEAITRNIALEFAPFGIKANCIQAGVTDTASLRAIPGSEKIKEHTLKRNPFKRLTTPEDVANVVYLLCKEEAKWINGCIIPVDGGEHIS